MGDSDKIVVENVNVPGSTTRVDAAKYAAMRHAMLSVAAREAPGLTQAEWLVALKPALPEDLFPGGKTSAWWQKTVQLDLEAKKKLVRVPGKPLRWFAID